MCFAIAAGKESHDDNAHGLLRVLDTVAQRHSRRGNTLRGAEAAHGAVVLSIAQKEENDTHDKVADNETDDW